MRTQRAARRPSIQAGFTLVETLVASSIFLLIMYAVYSVYESAEVNYSRGSRKWDVQSQARVALERMGREIRMAGYGVPKSPTPPAVFDPVVIATDDTFSFHADLDGTGAKYVTYTRRDCNGNVGTTLYRNLSTTSFCGGEPFIDNVTQLTFTFYELNNVPLPYPLPSSYQLDGQGPVTGTSAPTAPAAGGLRSRIRQVKVALTVQQQEHGITIPFTATTDVALRNLIP